MFKAHIYYVIYANAHETLKTLLFETTSLSKERVIISKNN